MSQKKIHSPTGPVAYNGYQVMRRLALALLVLAATQAACHSDYELYILNVGDESIVVDVQDYDGGYYESGHGHDVFIVPARTAILESYDSPNLDVLIFRNSDGLILFADGFDKHDFEDDHGKIEITIQP